MQTSKKKSGLNFKGLISASVPAPVRSVLEPAAIKLLALKRLDRIYRETPDLKSPGEFARALLDRLGCRFDVNAQEQFRIPASGPAIVVANHPFGGVEGLFMIWLLRCLRNDVRILANSHLSRIPEFKDLFIPVNPFGGVAARNENAAGLRSALRWVKSGRLLMLFPAGEVSHFDISTAAVCDPQWSPAAAGLIRLAQAPVVPAYFHGRNSLRFQLAGMVHPRLRTALLPRELLNKKDRCITVRIGQPIPFAKLAGIADDDALAAHLRIKTYVLASGIQPQKVPVEKIPAHKNPMKREVKPRKPVLSVVKDAGSRIARQSADLRQVVSAAKGVAKTAGVPARAPQALVTAIDAQVLQTEIAQLPVEQQLASNGALQVWHASAAQIPWLLQEIGRLRELTFRAVGEGTGRSSDIDLYDDYYEHLFVWNAEKAELVGAYRMGHADRIQKRFGKRGLYTNTLFELRDSLLRSLNPALELGRSFVQPDYQRSFAALLLLWKGIGEYVVRHPQYSVLFGAVSISNDYAPLSKEMLVRYFSLHNHDSRLARLVKARQPFRRRSTLRPLVNELKALRDVESFSALVSDFEPDGKGVPILLRQYLKLGGRLLGFNVDPEFSHSIDCLIMVDLRQTDPKVLNKYMGREGAGRFLKFHASRKSPSVTHLDAG